MQSGSAPPNDAAPGKTGPDRLVERMADILVRIAGTGEIRFFSPSGAVKLGRADGFFKRGMPLAEALALDDRARLSTALERLTNPKQQELRQELTLRMLHADASLIPVVCRILPVNERDPNSELIFAAWQFKLDDDRLLQGAQAEQFDDLTGLPGRRHLQQHLASLIHSAEAGGSEFAVFQLNLDAFKKVNESLGHECGDRLLVEAVSRLKTVLRATDFIARTGGDEFVLVMYGTHSADGVAIVARKLMVAMQKPFEIDGRTLHLSASIGVSLYPTHGDNEHMLLRRSDIALHKAKELGGQRWQLYVQDSSTAVEKRVRLEELMYDSVQNGEFEMYYQPLFETATGKMAGVEALMRWWHPVHGSISPLEFITLAEENGLINFLGRWSLRAACQQVSNWNKAWNSQLKASVNASPRQFREEDFVAQVSAALNESGLPPALLSMEITEGTLMHDPQATRLLLDEITALGAKISIDDFGTGYSSLAYLKRFPLNTLKIDRAFVRDLEEDANDRAIVNLIVSLARELGLQIVVEGVETQAQLDYLKSQGCNYVQGFLLGKPVPASELVRNVESGLWQPIPAKP